MKSGKATKTLNLRLHTSEKESFDLASSIAGIPLSAWVRERLRSAAIKDLEAAGILAPFLKEISGHGETK